MRFHVSAFKHGDVEEAILHAVHHEIVVVDLDPETDTPKMLTIGPDRAGNLLEVIWLDLAHTELVIHAMELRATFYELLPTGEDPMS